MNQETPSESTAFSLLESLRLSPVTLSMREISARSKDVEFDAIVDGTWDDENATFALEYKRLGTPKEFSNAVLQIKSWDLPDGTYPLLLLPYLKPEQLDELDRIGISGIDLCGNGVITIPGRLKVYRTGQPNRFKSNAGIKNIYRGKTSLVARIFATRDFFPSVQSLRDEIVNRDLLATSGMNKPIGLSTVSKALKTLEQDLIVAREDGGEIRLLQRDQLLESLLRSDEPLDGAEKLKLKVEVPNGNLIEWVSNQLKSINVPIIATGLSSTSQYAVMQREPIVRLYTPSISSVADQMTVRGGATETERFENVVLIGSKRPLEYFDRREEDSFPWASPLQTWLELMRGDKRDRETAEQVRELLLKSGSDA